jgi:hypothetical protein
LETHVLDLGLCALALVIWIVIVRSKRPIPGIVPVLGGVMVLELLGFAWNVNPQCDPQLYYPRLPALEYVAQAPPGRALCIGSLPANLLATHGLLDIRGYDAIDPARYTALLELARDKSLPPGPGYAKIQSYNPIAKITPQKTVEFPRIIDMLNVRYLILPGKHPQLDTCFSGGGHSVVENRRALPRAFVPRTVVSLSPGESALPKLDEKSFDPEQVAYVEGAVELTGEGRGQAEIQSEIPTRLELRADMQTSGLLVLADRWDDGWKATVNGQSAPILRTNHELRGVVLPAGQSLVQFHYEPASLCRGMVAMTAGLLTLLVWASVLSARRFIAGRRGPGDAHSS